MATKITAGMAAMVAADGAVAAAVDGIAEVGAAIITVDMIPRWDCIAGTSKDSTFDYQE
jgi:hypothetical protein